MMRNYTINEEWFNEIKDRVAYANDYHYNDGCYRDNMVEVDLDEETFIKVSKELGWM